MSRDGLSQQRTWFAAAAAIALILAALPVLWLMLRDGGGEAPRQDMALPIERPGEDGLPVDRRPDMETESTERRMDDTVPPDGRDDKFPKSGPKGPEPMEQRRETPKEEMAPRRQTPELRQTAEGQVLPWGGIAPGSAVVIEVTRVDRTRHEGLEFLVSRDDGDARLVRGRSLSAELRDLEPGRYRWNARLRERGRTRTLVVTPPRGELDGADFVVLPALLILSDMSQARLDGGPIGGDGRTERGALLRGWASVPDAVLEVEVKPAGEPFDGRNPIRAAFRDGGAEVSFLPDRNGVYRWRARVTVGRGRDDPWREFGRPEGGDFVVFGLKPPEQVGGTGPGAGGPGGGDPDQGGGKDARQDGGKQTGGSGDRGGTGKVVRASGGMSGAISGGSNVPLPSVVQPLPSLWQMAVVRVLLGLGGVAVLLLAALAVARTVRRSARRAT